MADAIDYAQAFGYAWQILVELENGEVAAAEVAEFAKTGLDELAQFYPQCVGILSRK